MYKILIADDEQAIVSLLSDYLKLNRYEVLVAYDGNEAVKQALKGPDLILLDVNMPGGDGFSVCSEWMPDLGRNLFREGLALCWWRFADRVRVRGRSMEKKGQMPVAVKHSPAKKDSMDFYNGNLRETCIFMQVFSFFLNSFVL